MAKSKAGLNTQILEEASGWFVDFSEGEVDAAGREAFNRWLRTSPEHVRAYLQIAAFWEEAEFLNKDRQRDMQALIDQALAASNVVPLEWPDGSQRSLETESQTDEAAKAGRVEPAVPRDISRRWTRRLAVAASIAALCVGAGAVTWFQAYRAGTYTTQIGEQRAITLEDGSIVDLNSHSRLRVRFTAQVRAVELLEGQALFRVAKNPARPFVVRSGETNVRAVGTQFDVYRRRGATVVTVVEGRVAVSNTQPRTAARADTQQDRSVASSTAAQTGSGPVLLSAGEQVTATALAVTAPQPTNVTVATAWTQQKLVFESAPLGEVVDEFNRYNRRQLIIEDSQLNEFHISGVFASTDSSRLVEFLKQRFAVGVEEDEDEIRISRP